MRARDDSEARHGLRGAFDNLRAVEASIRRLFFHGGRLVPAAVAAILVLLALWPMLSNPAEKMIGTLASMAGAGLSFASVTFSAASARREREAWSRRMVATGLMLLRFSVASIVALALAATRARLVLDLGGGTPLDYGFRVVMALVTAVGIGMAFLGFRSLVLLLGPALDDEPAVRPAAELGPPAAPAGEHAADS